ncbi:MAG TPA: YbjN domain-containing protein [Sphingomonadaceae bacterium]|nr:YbjN domain-containing protein [Sphingomonadaceae bacterium]
MKKLALFASALALGLGSTAVSAQDDGQIRILLNFDGPELTQTLEAMGATWERRNGDQGQAIYIVKLKNGATAVAAPSICRGEMVNSGCTGLNLYARFSKPEGKTPGAVAQFVNQYNRGHAATMATHDGQGNAQLNMYIIAEHGIALANLRTQLTVFESGTGSFSRDLYAQPE